MATKNTPPAVGHEKPTRTAPVPPAYGTSKRRKRKGRSRVTNGAVILAGLAADGRTHIARRYTDLVAAACVDQGGANRMSEARLQLVRRFAGLAVQLETLEARLANGEPINVAEYTQLTSTLVRVVSRLGLERVAKDIGPTFADLWKADLKHRQRSAPPPEPLDDEENHDHGS